ncbi:MAG: lipid-A-disaccharide synthase [Candidatus Acidiferrales bacterium]
MISKEPPQILISAGEASGDMYAARLATALQQRTGAKIFGMGGPRMREAGVELIVDAKEIAVLGITEVIHKVPTVLKILRRLRNEAARRKPALSILVDSPGTNLPLGKKLHRLNLRVVYFITPQIWAWRPWRIRAMKRILTRVLVIFPFEESIYKDAGIPVDFVGHPLVDVVRPSKSRVEFLNVHGLDVSRPVVALLPGSRPSEIGLNLPDMLDACEGLARDLKPQFVMAAAPGIPEQFFQRYMRPGLATTRIAGEPYDILASSDCAIVSSGTATVEAALLGTPMVVVYRVSAPSAFILRRMIRAPHLAMVNLIAGRKIVPELIQDDFKGPRVEAEVRRLLSSAEHRETMKRDLADMAARLGTGGAIDRAADVLAAMLSQ